jgi:hypothetical protein
MNKKLNTSGMTRRQFLQTSAASATFLALGGVQSFAASSAGAPENSIPWVTLNNGLKMPLLGFD